MEQIELIQVLKGLGLDKKPENQINSLEYIKEFLSAHYAQKQIKSIKPYCFTVGSDNHGEGLKYDYGLTNSLFFGNLYLSINPTGDVLQDEKIEIKYRSYLNHTPYYKYITRVVEKENMINEASASTELFDSLQVTQASSRYDFYFSFVGFKIDLI